MDPRSDPPGRVCPVGEVIELVDGAKQQIETVVLATVPDESRLINFRRQPWFQQILRHQFPPRGRIGDPIPGVAIIRDGRELAAGRDAHPGSTGLFVTPGQNVRGAAPVSGRLRRPITVLVTVGPEYQPEVRMIIVRKYCKAHVFPAPQRTATSIPSCDAGIETL